MGKPSSHLRFNLRPPGLILLIPSPSVTVNACIMWWILVVHVIDSKKWFLLIYFLRHWPPSPHLHSIVSKTTILPIPSPSQTVHTFNICNMWLILLMLPMEEQVCTYVNKLLGPSPSHYFLLGRVEKTNFSNYFYDYIFLTANADRRAVSFTLAEKGRRRREDP